MRRRDYQLRRRGISDFGVRRRGEPFDPDVAVGLCGEVDVEEMIGRVLRVKRNAKEAALAAAQHPARDVEEWRRLQCAVSDHPDSPSLLHDENSSVVQRLGEKDGRAQAGRDERIQLESEAWRQRPTIAGTGG